MRTKIKQKRCGREYIYTLIVLIVFFLDRITKNFVKDKFLLHESVPVVDKVFNITYITNTGAGFGIFREFNLPLLFLLIAVAGFILIYFDSFKTKYEKICLSLVLAGVIGNAFDRLFYGFVVDFIDFNFWPAFNFADSAICVGIIGLVIYYWKKGE